MIIDISLSKEEVERVLTAHMLKDIKEDAEPEIQSFMLYASGAALLKVLV